MSTGDEQSNWSLIPPGRPGIVPRWTSSAKIGVGTALGHSVVWFTISHGIVNEVYFPRIDLANTRDMGLIVTNGQTFFSEEKRDAVHEYATLEVGVPAYQLTNTCLQEKYRIHKTIITDPHRNVLLQKIRFEVLEGSLEDYHLYVLLAPHLQNAGYGNSGYACQYKGSPMLFAERNNTFLALACSFPFQAMTCGYVGVSDAWQDLYQNKRLTQFYQSAPEGNIALAGEINLKESKGEFVLALGFGKNREEAGIQCRASLLHPFEQTLDDYIKGWKTIQSACSFFSSLEPEAVHLFRTSIAIFKTHAAKYLTGGVIASLSIPWGFARGDNDIGGYHLVWPRDQVQIAWAFLAAHDVKSARDSLLYLMCTQEADGHWIQCMWSDGLPYWQGIQLDETALPILLADHLYRIGGLDGLDPLPMIEKAVGFLVRFGPSTDQDRWEEEEGYTSFTLGAVIAALLAGADFFERDGRVTQAQYLRETADCWNESIEYWLYAKDTEMTRKYAVEGYYVRILPRDVVVEQGQQKLIFLKNHLPEDGFVDIKQLISVDALALVRFGLRSPDDPRVLNTVRVIDALLKTETTKGSVWHRYNHDGYGEHADGSPYNGTGIGRGWPLLTGERAHYELARGDHEEALRLLHLMVKQAGTGGMIPEQVWDSEDIPDRRLYNGHSSGSAKPLVWAHAEYINLVRSVKDKDVFNRPPQTVQRYLKDKQESCFVFWRLNHRPFCIPSGKILRIEALRPACVRWTVNQWQQMQESVMIDSGLGIFYTDLPVDKEQDKTVVIFTFFWVDEQQWEGKNYETIIDHSFEGFLI